MASANGTITVNGITDSELAEILEIKARHIGQSQFFSFNPQSLQQTAAGGAYGIQSLYNNAVFGWTGQEGFKVVEEIINFLFTGQKTKAQGQ